VTFSAAARVPDLRSTSSAWQASRQAGRQNAQEPGKSTCRGSSLYSDDVTFYAALTVCRHVQCRPSRKSRRIGPYNLDVPRLRAQPRYRSAMLTGLPRGRNEKKEDQERKRECGSVGAREREKIRREIGMPRSSGRLRSAVRNAKRHDERDGYVLRVDSRSGINARADKNRRPPQRRSEAREGFEILSEDAASRTEKASDAMPTQRDVNVIGQQHVGRIRPIDTRRSATSAGSRAVRIVGRAELASSKRDRGSACRDKKGEGRRGGFPSERCSCRLSVRRVRPMATRFGVTGS